MFQKHKSLGAKCKFTLYIRSIQLAVTLLLKKISVVGYTVKDHGQPVSLRSL